MKKNNNYKIMFSISSKNTFRQPRRSLLLGGAIAFSVLIISLSMGFTTGMENSVQSNVTIFSAGHILINGYARSESGRAQNRISDQMLAEVVKKDIPQALSVSSTAQSQATVVFGSREQQLRLRGVDWDTDKLFSGSLILKQGDWQAAKADRAMMLGAQSAKRFGLGLGDSLLVRLSTFSGQQNVVEYKLAAVYDDTAAGGMTTALVPLADLQQDLNLPAGEFQTLAVFLPDAASSDKVAVQLQKNLTDQGYLLTPSAGQTTQARQTGQAPAQGGQATQASQAQQSAPAGAASQQNPVPQGGKEAASTSLTSTTVAAQTTAAVASGSAARQGAAQGTGNGSARTGTRRSAGSRLAPGVSAKQTQSQATAPAQGSAGNRNQAAAAGQAASATQPAQAPGSLAGSLAGSQAGSQGDAPMGGGFRRGGFNDMNVPEGKTLYRVSTITQLSGQVGAVLGSVRWIGIAIFLIMLMLTATGITNTYRMVLLERTKEIGMMRCIGFHKSQVFWVFLFESAILALAGSLGGILLSFPIGWLIHVIPFNASGELGQALSRGRLVYAPTFGTLLIIIVAVLASSMIAVYWPARRASELQPVEAIRQTA